MKTPRLRLWFAAFAAFVFAANVHASRDWEGAWKSSDGSTQRVLMIVDGYWTMAEFSQAAPQFHRTMGGTFKADGRNVTSALQFDSADKSQVGTTFSVQLERRGDELHVRQDNGSVDVWRRAPGEETALSGVWWISGRVRDGKEELRELRARRTLKVLTGGRFQWIAINLETGEFSGTGGGTYTYREGKYVETIEFFSRDNTRVGASLPFDGSVKNGVWHHSGLSSQGNPIYELWSRLPKEG